MKYIKYRFPCGESVFEKAIAWSEEAENIAKAEAINGEYTIEDDGQEEPHQPSDVDARIATLEERLAAYEAAYLEGVNEA